MQIVLANPPPDFLTTDFSSLEEAVFDPIRQLQRRWVEREVWTQIAEQIDGLFDEDGEWRLEDDPGASVLPAPPQRRRGPPAVVLH